MSKTLYIGAKCVPSFYIGSGGSSDWQQGIPFEPLTVVTYEDRWYISKRAVPSNAGAPEAGAYWALVPGYVTDVTPEELQAILDDIEDLQEDAGDLDDLETTAKTNLVAAVNEVKGETTELKDDLIKSQVVYSSTARTADASATGWRLNESDGLCAQNDSYKLVKYTVTAGDYVKVVSDDRFQFQTIASVPSSGTNNRVGVTYGTGTFCLEVPDTATYLIVSTPTTSNAAVYAKESTIPEDVADLQEEVSQIVPGLTDDAKEALLACFEHVAWADESGQSCYNSLYEALTGITPDPDVPTAYTRYDYIRLKRYSEVPSGVYTGGGANAGNVDISGAGLAPQISTNMYSDLNALKYKTKIGIIYSSSLATSVNSCAFGGGVADGATSRFATYWNAARQWVYLMAHGQEVKHTQALSEVNNVEIINGSSSPTQLKIGSTTHDHAWVNSNVINCQIAYFRNPNWNASNDQFMGAGTYVKVGDIEIRNQNDELISKLIPVVRNSDSVIGIYDSIRREFYTTSDSKYATIGNSYCIYAVGRWDE